MKAEGQAIAAPNTRTFLAFVNALDEAGVEYVLVGRVDQYPEIIHSDVDFIVREPDLVRLPRILADVAARSGGKLVQCLRHEIGAAYFAIAVENGATVSFLHPDASGDYRRHGKLWLRATDLLQDRRLHPAGFWIPGIAQGLFYYLVKRIDKGVVDDVHLEFMREQFMLAPAACTTFLEGRLGSELARSVASVLGGAAAPDDARRLLVLREALNANASVEGFVDRAGNLIRNAGRWIARVVRPTGVVVGFLGPDGSGKSTLIRHATESLLPAFRQQRYFHLRPQAFFGGKKGGSVVTDPHGKPARGAILSCAKLGALMVDYVFGYWFVVRPLAIRSLFIVFDRYLHDMQADPLRYRWGGPLVLLQGACMTAPEPDVWIVLDAPTEMLLARKGEVTAEAAQSQRLAYTGLARHLRHALLVDTSRPIDECVADVNRHVLDYLAARTRRRLGLKGPGHV